MDYFFDKKEHYTDDITFCDSDCKKIRCGRHKKNMIVPFIPHSFSDFSKVCESYKGENNDKERTNH